MIYVEYSAYGIKQIYLVQNHQNYIFFPTSLVVTYSVLISRAHSIKIPLI